MLGEDSRFARLVLFMRQHAGFLQPEVFAHLVPEMLHF
jgi:hypothetical protein